VQLSQRGACIHIEHFLKTLCSLSSKDLVAGCVSLSNRFQNKCCFRSRVTFGKLGRVLNNFGRGICKKNLGSPAALSSCELFINVKRLHASKGAGVAEEKVDTPHSSRAERVRKKSIHRKWFAFVPSLHEECPSSCPMEHKTSLSLSSSRSK
jgi:hypothetical protein